MAAQAEILTGVGAGTEYRNRPAPARARITGLRARFEPLTLGLADMVPLAPGPHDTIDVHAPFTAECIGTVPATTPEDVALAAERAQRAQQAWAATPLDERRRVFLRYHDLVLDRREALLDLIQIEGGKARRHAVEEFFDVPLNARYYAQHAHEYLRPRRRQSLVPLFIRSWEYRHPLGVVGIIAPWNYPFTMAVSDAMPALIAGNAIILKPAELTPFSALYAVKLLYEAGLPGDLFQVLTGRGRSIGSAIIRHSDFINFTGSTEVGRLIGEQAGRKLVRASLELGGKNAMIVLNDADLDRAVSGAIMGCWASAGQLCISFERIYVQHGIFKEFVEEFVRRTKALRLGTALDYSVDVGSMIGQDQFDKTYEHIEDAIDKGATVLTGGSKRPDIGPYFLEPTVLTGVTSEMKCYREETFGPVVAVYPVETAEEAVARANDSEFGLNSSLWTRNVRHGRELAQRVEAGTVNVNCAYAAAWSSMGAPMGGMKDSGMGRRHGAEGIQKYTETQNVTVTVAPVFPPFGMDVETAAEVMPYVLRLIKNIPGLR
jgi:succinate-semialdehyde dehydrogenase / glutarate-semialdehyde dehydrogenase